MSSPNSTSRPLWVSIYLNGDHTISNGVKVNIQHVKTLPEMFQLALAELNLLNMNLQLTRLFSIDGTEVTNINQLYSDDFIWFSAGEDFERLPESVVAGVLDKSTDPANEQANDPSQGYIYTAAVFSAGLVAGGYNLVASSVRSHGPQSLVNGFNSMEASASQYTPYFSSVIPYISSSIKWSDKMLNQCVEATKQKTNEFLTTPTGQSIQAQFLTPLSEYTSHAVQSFKLATVGDPNNPHHSPNTAADPNSPSPTPQQQDEHNQQHYQRYLANMQASIGSTWNNSLLPWAEEMYKSLGEQVQGANAAAASGAVPTQVAHTGIDAQDVQQPLPTQ